MIRLTITLDLIGSVDDAEYVANKLLDAGAVQDLINEHDFDAGDLAILDASASAEEVDDEEEDES